MWNGPRLHRAGKLKAMQATSALTKPGVRDLEAENERLRRELANTKVDLDIVKTAAEFTVQLRPGHRMTPAQIA
jgi:hypothetical protein